MISHCCVNLHFPTIINLNNFAMWISSFLNCLFTVVLCIFLSCLFWGGANLSMCFCLIDVNLWSVMCLILYPKSTIFLILLVASFFFFFGTQVYKDVYTVKCVYLLFSMSWFPVSVWKVFVNLRIIGRSKEAPGPSGERCLPQGPPTRTMDNEVKKFCLWLGTLSSDHG